MKNVVLSISVVVILICHCGFGSQDHAGGTTSTRNALVVGALMHKDGSVAPNVNVSCIPADYVPGFSDKKLIRYGVTDNTGIYIFSSLDSGSYVITAVDKTNLTRCMIQGADVVHDTVLLQSGILDIPGTVKISVPDKAAFSSGYFYIPGTTISSGLVKENTTGYIILDSVPGTVISSVNYVSASDKQYRIIRTKVPVSGADTTSLDNILWKFTKTVQLNTSSSGANISGMVTNFPVLIRLTKGNFDFSATQSDGSDIKFTKEDNTILSHEFERWDPVNGFADIWVKVDTIQGNDSLQKLIMYYGNTGVQTRISNSAVFDTSNKFMGVWHLDESSSTLNDATVNKYSGLRTSSVSECEGKIETGQFLKDSTAYCDFGNVMNPGNNSFTISTWYKRGGNGLQTLIAKTNGGLPSVSYGWYFGFNLSDQIQCNIASGGNKWGDTGTFSIYSVVQLVDTTTWHNIAVVVDKTNNDNCKIYFDGISLPFNTIGDIRTVGELVNTSSLRFGVEADGDNSYKGKLDECEVSYTVRSPEWIKLCYMNQRKDDKLTVVNK